MDCISDGLKSLLLIDVAFATQNFPFSGINCSHGIAFVPSKSSSKVVALKLPAFKRTLSVVRRNIFARHIALVSPVNVTLPSFEFLVILYPRFIISFLILLQAQSGKGQ